MSRYPQFDRQRLKLKPLSERGHDLVSSACWPLEPIREAFDHPEFPELIARIIAARKNNRPVVLMMGAHPIKLGLSRFLIDHTHQAVTMLDLLVPFGREPPRPIFADARCEPAKPPRKIGEANGIFSA